MKQQAFFYEGKTGIAVTKGFQRKGLADYSCNIGSVCAFGCTFCYVQSVVGKQGPVQEIIKSGLSFDDFSLYRSRENVLVCLRRDLRKIRPDDRDTVFFCTTCDPYATESHFETTAAAISLIMKESGLQVRVLSKSTLILDLAVCLKDYKDRIVYSLSTGTSRPEISACIEGKASPIKDRVKALGLLQATGFRIYGMICPVMPFESDDVPALIDQVNPDAYELVWAEAVNIRGKSLAKTVDKLARCGLSDEAMAVARVMGDKAAWRAYSVDLFRRFQEEMRRRGQLHKLRFLQYTTKEPADFHQFFQSQEGAVCL